MTKKVILINKYIIVATILFFATSCSNTGDNLELDNHKKVNLIANKQAFEKAESNRKNGTGNELSDPFDIESIERVGDILKVKISYKGGCEEHSFDLVWNDEIMIMIYPCQINLILTHDAHGDQCETRITEILEIDLTELNITCDLNVFNIFNGSDDPDSFVTSLDN